MRIKAYLPPGNVKYLIDLIAVLILKMYIFKWVIKLSAYL